MPTKCKTLGDLLRPIRDKQRGSAYARGYDKRWARWARMVLAREPVCRMRGCGRAATEVHHIIPKSQGGSDRLDNLMGVCKSCHSRLTAQEVGLGKQ